MPKKNYNMPSVFVELGKLKEIRISNGDGEFDITWPDRMRPLLVCNPVGDKLFSFLPEKSKKALDFTKGVLDQVDRAAETFEEWHEKSATKANPRRLHNGKMANLGRCIHIIYDSDKWDKKDRYIHTFKNPPSVKADNSEDPKTVIISGQKLAVRPEGITG